MSVAVWLVSLFVLGIVAMVLCYLFMEACDKI